MSDEESGDFFLNNSDDNWEPLPDDFKFVSRNSSSSSSSSSSHSDINNLAVALSEFQIKPPPPPPQPPTPPPPPPQQPILEEEPSSQTRPNIFSNEDDYLNFIYSLQNNYYEATELVSLYNQIIKPKKPINPRSFGQLQTTKQFFKKKVKQVKRKNKTFYKKLNK